MSKFQAGLLGTLSLVAVATASEHAVAAQPVAQGTFAVAAERLVSSNFHFWQGGTDWNNQLLGSPGEVPFDTPRLGADYFVIDGLSLGGHVSTGLWIPNGGTTGGWLALLPRVGYAFQLSDKIDFWPRVGAGFIVGNMARGETAVVTAEAMFLYSLVPHVSLEFGPAVDLPLANQWQNAIVGANLGLALLF
jgi:hypothetical protein